MRSHKYLLGAALFFVSATSVPALAEPNAPAAKSAQAPAKSKSGQAPAKSGPLAGEELRKTFSGKTFRISTPVGTFAVSFQPNGTMAGTSGTQLASMDGASNDEKDTGQWQVRGDQLCQKWRSWLNGETVCVRISKSGETFYWRSADGYSGEAKLLR
jgi:hypothetical protein